MVVYPISQVRNRCTTVAAHLSELYRHDGSCTTPNHDDGGLCHCTPFVETPKLALGEVGSTWHIKSKVPESIEALERIGQGQESS